MPGVPEPAPPRRLGLFGGSFNPPHVAHLAVAEAAREALALDGVLWMPAAASPHKAGDASVAPAPHRLAMTRLAVAGNDAFSVSDLEAARGGASYTVDTLRALREARPGVAWTLILGGDSLASFDRWREPEAILGLAELAVYDRPGADLAAVRPALLARAARLDAPALDLSATQLRARVASGRSVRYLVPDAVRAYIAEHGLYRGA